MTFMDDVNAEIRVTGKPCKTCGLLKSVDAKTRTEIETVMADQMYSASVISRAMAKRGWEVSDGAIRKHRQKCVIL